MLQRLRVPALVLCAAWAFAGCTIGSTKSSSGPPAATTTTASPTTTTTAPATTTSPTGATDLKVTDQIRAQLLAAGAASKGLSPSDYTGLLPGMTYYAYDAQTSTYWAGAGLVPTNNSYQAQVSNQDDGAYLVFQMPAGGTWSATPTGAAGPNAVCQVQIPAAVLTVWHWAPGTCLPPGGP